MSQKSNNPFIVNDDLGRPRVLDTSGRQMVKHGSTGNETFYEAIIISYSNLMNHLHLVIFYVFLAGVFVFELADDKSGPLEMILKTCESINSDDKALAFEKPIAKFLIWLINLLLPYKLKFIAAAFAFFAYSFKPSRSNLWVGVIVVLMIFLLRDWNALDFILFSQLHHIFVSVRNPFHKLVVLTLGIFIFFVAVQLGKSPSEHHGLYTKAKEYAKAGVKQVSSSASQSPGHTTSKRSIKPEMLKPAGNNP